jgi:hypothetical protein
MDSERLKKFTVEVVKYVATTAGGIVVTALIKGEPLGGLTRFRTLLPFLQTAIPLWVLLITLAVCVALITRVVDVRHKPSAKLHISWDRSQCLWHKADSGGEPAMQIMGWALISSADTVETLIIREAYIKGCEPIMNLIGDLIIEPGQVYRRQICTFVQPVILDETKPLVARLILVDHKNRKFVTPRMTFRATPAPNQVTADNR